MKTSRFKIAAAFAAILAASIAVCMAAYEGHQDDSDVAAMLKAYPQLKGTSLDSCNTCHTGGGVPDSEKPGQTRVVNSCDYCHVIYKDGAADATDTLNGFGKDYRNGLRTRSAFQSIAQKDSDGDGFTNADEIANLTMPGSADSSPAMKPAPHIVMSLDEMSGSLPIVKETVFIDSYKSMEGDTYYTYRGFKMSDILKAAGMADNAVSIDVISVDGYSKTFPIDRIDRLFKQAAPVFGLGKEDLGACGWVHYDGEGLKPSVPLPDEYFILSFEQNGKKYGRAALDAKTGRITEHGPFRTVMPQSVISPPDLPAFADASCPPKVDEIYRYHKDYEKNSDFAVKAVVAIRVNPLPEGARDFNWQDQGGWEYVDNDRIIIYGALKK
jgi:hypothetical protein